MGMSFGDIIKAIGIIVFVVITLIFSITVGGFWSTPVGRGLINLFS